MKRRTTFHLSMFTTGEAFEENPEVEVGRLLDQAMRKVMVENATEGRLLDYNGNLVGTFTWK
jgi:hypothetical protein